MQGKALFGKYASDEKHEIQFALAANQLHHFMPVRAATDGRFKYIRSYIPYRQLPCAITTNGACRPTKHGTSWF